MCELEECINRQRSNLNQSLPDFRTVDLGFWDIKGDYQVDYQDIGKE